MYLKIKVFPDSRAERVEKISEEEWKVWTKKPAERNLVYEIVLEFVREKYLDEQVRIVSGHHSPLKIVSIG